MFNFKNVEDQKKFFHLTETKTELTKCFQNDNSIAEQSQQWFKNLNKYFHLSFRKIRNCKVKKKLNVLDILLKTRTDLVQKLKTIEEDKKEDVRNNMN